MVLLTQESDLRKERGDKMELNANSFERVGTDLKSAQTILRPSMTYFQDAMRRFKKNKVAVASLIYMVVIILGSILIPMFSKRSMSEQDLLSTFLSPFKNGYIFGTDELGRDLWVRVWYGARVSLTIGFAAAFVDFLIGVIIGGIAGYYGGKIDNIIMRIADVLIGIPYLMIVILLTMVFSPGIITIVIALTITGWTGMARLVRGQIMQLKEQEFVLAAKVLGANAPRIILKHLLPNTLGIIIVRMTLNIPSAIFSEAFLSFIGLGVKLPIASWGALASDGVAAFQQYPHVLLIPAAFICLTMLALNILGDAFRDALDPKLRK